MLKTILRSQKNGAQLGAHRVFGAAGFRSRLSTDRLDHASKIFRALKQIKS